jgi:CRISPR-associated protein Cas2
MVRNLYLVAYDVADPKRLYQVHKRMRGFGDPLQFSVFVCLLSPRELALLYEKMDGEIKKTEDRLMVVNLGPEEGNAEDRITFVGLKKDLPTRRSIVV